MKTIVLIGMMGCGKSTIGKAFSQETGLEFFDIDLLVEKKENKSISEIFKTKGEEYFRKIEQEVLFENFRDSNLVISLGGGAFENSQTQEFLLANSIVIYLQSSSDTIFSRIKFDKTRPLLADNISIKRIEKLQNERKQNYEKAHFIIKTDFKTKEEIINEILGVLKDD